jgi:hypothetical protein
MSKPASFVLDIRTGPAITSLSRGPLIAKSTDKVPPFNSDPEGSTMPKAGSIVSSSSIGMSGALSLRFITCFSPWV